ncbi:uncharacterized protein ACNS7B_019035 [Menidia menidia]
MSDSGGKEEPSNKPQDGDHDGKKVKKRPTPLIPGETTPPESVSGLSIKRHKSRDPPFKFKQDSSHSIKPAPPIPGERKPPESVSGLSIKSYTSMDLPFKFKQDSSNSVRPTPLITGERTPPESVSGLSVKSDASMDLPFKFKQDSSHSIRPAHLIPGEKTPPKSVSGLSIKSDASMDLPFKFKQDSSHSIRPAPLLDEAARDRGVSDVDTCTPSEDDIFTLLGSDISEFVQGELSKIQRILEMKSEEDVYSDDEEPRNRATDGFLKMVLYFLHSRKREDMADLLENTILNGTAAARGQRKLKAHLKTKYESVFEGTFKAGKPASLNQIFTDLYVTEGESADIKNEHEVRQIETVTRRMTANEKVIKCEDIFINCPGKHEPIRTVITKGVAGIGKTVLTQKFALDWAEDRSNQNIKFMFPFSFRELNTLKEKKFSLVELVHQFFPDIKEAGICRFENFQVLFILDGLDECRLPLNMNSDEVVTDITESSSLDGLLTNLIKGKLLPSARLWITTRPAAANQIPADCVDMVTEVRGFMDIKKEEYFKRRFGEEKKANRIISHIKRTRTLHIMCHIPVFCWISATVLEEKLKTKEVEELPKSLTEMYIHFLIVQLKVKKQKYDGGAETDQHWSPENRKMIESLGKLAFEQLQKGNLFFYESDLRESGIDVTEASVYSGVFTQIFQEESGLYHNKVFCFIHLTVQEFLAALHVHLTFMSSGVNLLSEEESSSASFSDKSELFYQKAVDRALESPNGHLDMFLRFLLGLSLPTNHSLLRGLVTQTGSGSSQNTVQFIKRRIDESSSPEKSINLFHCLNELKDRSLTEEIQQFLRSGGLSTGKLSSLQWSALVFFLLSSEEGQEFDLKKYSASEEALLRLLPVVQDSPKAVLSCCNLSERICEALASVLGSQSCRMTELDLSNNDLRDSGVKQLCKGLQSPHCKLKTLRLSGCLITEEGWAALDLALRSKPSSLKELDLSYNHIGDLGKKPAASYGLKVLKVDHNEETTMKPGLRKYACELSLDPNTVHGELKLSENNKTVSLTKYAHPYPDHPERFDFRHQVMGTHCLSTADRCYWEVERDGAAQIAVTYKGIARKGQFDDVCLGNNDQSWSLTCSNAGWSFLHNNNRTPIYALPSSRVGVYLDWPANTLSFYSVTSEKLIHLHTLHTTFTEPLYPAFRLKSLQPKCSVSLCQMLLSQTTETFVTADLSFEPGSSAWNMDKANQSTVALKEKRSDQSKVEDPSPSCASIKSGMSMELPVVFRNDPVSGPDQSKVEDPSPSCASLKSGMSMELPVVFRNDSMSDSPAVQSNETYQHESAHQNTSDVSTHQKKLDSVFQIVEETMVTFVRKELKLFRKMLSTDFAECFESLDEEEKGINHGEQDKKTSNRDAVLNMTLHFLTKIKELELADALLNKTLAAACHQKLKSSLRTRSNRVFEGIAQAGNPIQLNQIYTELYITEGNAAEVNSEHEVRLIEAQFRKTEISQKIKYQDIFTPSHGTNGPIKTVVTNGVAGIGKTILTRKFALDWAEGKANKDIKFVFPFSFRELNVLKEKKFSLVELVHQFFPETKDICRFEQFQVLLILDGLDECRLPLNMNSDEFVTDITESSSLDGLLTNLIKGKLLPSARLWITTRPAAANQIPADCVDMVTEVRGFTDPQKEEYFKKKFREEEEANRIISHIKTTRTLHIMCHIPVFCWISAKVLENQFKTKEVEELPKSLTEMYIHFLVVQLKAKKLKYDGGAETDQHWSPENRKMIESLGKLAFEQLQKGNLIFYESDLIESGIDVTEASVYSGVFTQIFQEESGLYHNKVFCFIHLTVQEFLAALHVHLTFFKSNVNLMSKEKPTSQWFSLLKGKTNPTNLYQSAVEQALESPNGHLDMFLRFLLGLSQTSNAHLRDLMTAPAVGSLVNQETVQYIKKRLSENLSPEKSFNLFHCLKELHDSSLTTEIQQHLKSGKSMLNKLSSSEWSALVFILLSSEEDLDEFDLKKYSDSEEALLKLLPLVKVSTKAILNCCNLSQKSCEALASILSSQSCRLIELDLSNNDLHDSGLGHLCKGLQSPRCKLEALSLSGCQITKKGCVPLISALTSNPSHLKKLDLSYNHPEDSAEKIRARQEDPNWALQTLKMEPAGPQFMKPGLRKYACEPVLDPHTAHRNLILSNYNKDVTMGKDRQPYPDHPERFDYWKQLLCTEGMTSRHYWEVEWSGKVYIAATYKSIKRKGESDDCTLGKNDHSWSLLCAEEGHSGLHNNKSVSIHGTPSRRVGVYLDWPAGTLSFFKVSSDGPTLLQTFCSRFTEPVYPAFRIRTEPFNSSLSLCNTA